MFEVPRVPSSDLGLQGRLNSLHFFNRACDCGCDGSVVQALLVLRFARCFSLIGALHAACWWTM